MVKQKKTPKAKKAPLPKDSFAPIAKELALAYGRINGAPARRLKWLLNFSELNLDSLSEGRLADLRWELVVFALNRKPEEMKGRFGIYYELTLLTLTVPVLKDMPSSEIEKAFPKAETEEEYKKILEARESEERKGASLWLVKEFQTTMREIFTTLFSGEPWRFSRPVQPEALALTHIKPKSGAEWAHNPPAYTAQDILLMQVIDLIKAEWPRLRRCQNPRCNRHPRFVAAKKGRAQFCSPQCSAYVRVNKNRAGKM